MSRALKIFLVIIGLLTTVVCGFFLFIHIAFDGMFTGPSYDQNDLIENYEQRRGEIIEVKNYFESIMPENATVHIEFDNDEELGIFHVKVDSVYENNWGLKIKSAKVDSLLNELGWTKAELRTLKLKLDKANSVSISSRKPVTIGWQRSGMGMFKYKIFDQNLNDSLMERYNDGCMFKFYKENVVLEYGGGAIGPQCFPGYERKEAAANKIK